MDPLETTETRPVGHHRARAIICGRLETIEMPDYPPDVVAEGHDVRMLRAPMGLREAARRLGVTASWLSDVEAGRRRLVHREAAMDAMCRAWDR